DPSAGGHMEPPLQTPRPQRLRGKTLELPPPPIDDLPLDARLPARPVSPCARGALGRPDAPPAGGGGRFGPPDHTRGRAVMHPRRMDGHREQEALRIHEEAALAPVDLLAAVTAPLSSLLGRLRRLDAR